jgi:hypothetical protein
MHSAARSHARTSSCSVCCSAAVSRPGALVAHGPCLNRAALSMSGSYFQSGGAGPKLGWSGARASVLPPGRRALLLRLLLMPPPPPRGRSAARVEASRRCCGGGDVAISDVDALAAPDTAASGRAGPPRHGGTGCSWLLRIAIIRYVLQ